MRRPALVLALALAVPAAAPSLAAAAPAIPDPRPPQNPHLAKNPHSNIHNDTWMTDTYAIGGPRGRDLRTAFGPLTASICGSPGVRQPRAHRRRLPVAHRPRPSCG